MTMSRDDRRVETIIHWLDQQRMLYRQRPAARLVRAPYSRGAGAVIEWESRQTARAGSA